MLTITNSSNKNNFQQITDILMAFLQFGELILVITWKKKQKQKQKNKTKLYVFSFVCPLLFDVFLNDFC